MRARPPLLAAVALLGVGCSRSAAGEGPRVGPADAGTESVTTLEEVSLDSTARSSTTTGDSAVDTTPLPEHPVVTDNRLYVVGDSIAESISSRYSGLICDALGPLGWDVTVDAVQGRRSDQAVRSLRANQSQVGQVVMVLIGHNDGGDPQTYRYQIGQLIGLVPDARRIVLITNYEFERGRDRMNDVLREIAAADGDGGPDDRLQLVDWNAAVEGVDGAIQRDGIHLTGSGQKALAAVMAAALGRAPDVGELPDDRVCTTLRDRIGSGSSGSGNSGSGGTRRTTTTAAEAPATEPPAEPPPGTEAPPGTDGPKPTDAPEPSNAPPGTGQGGSPPDSGKSEPPNKGNSSGPTSAPAPPGT